LQARCRQQIPGEAPAELQDYGRLEIELSLDNAATPRSQAGAREFFNSFAGRR